jgi:fused signal recognition particle receptor
MSNSSEGWFSRLKHGLERTRINIVGLFSGGVIDDDFLDELEYALITADVGVETSSLILQRLRDTIKLKGLKTPDEVRLALRDEIAALLKPAEKPLDISRAKPFVIMMAGVNGAGKTTSIGKLSKLFSSQGKSVLLAAGDTFRAAAREQLAVWGERNRVEVISQQGGDPAAVVFDAVTAAKARGIDVLIADTAGRLPTQVNLMSELRRIRRAQDKAMPGAPHEALLVVDGTNGQNALGAGARLRRRRRPHGPHRHQARRHGQGRRAARHHAHAPRQAPADLLHRRGRRHRRPAALQCAAFSPTPWSGSIRRRRNKKTFIGTEPSCF